MSSQMKRRDFCKGAVSSAAVMALDAMAIAENDAITSIDESCFFEKIKNEHAGNERALAILGDSLSVMHEMRSDSVDLIFADPPYNIGKDFGNNSDKWDNVEEYVSWCERWIDECMRVLKPDGTMYFMTATQHMPFLDVYVSRKYHVLSRIIWAYDSSGVQSKKMFGSLYEPILMIARSKDSQIVFNSQDILVEAKTGSQRKLIDYRKDPPQPYSTEKVPGNVWQFPRVRFRMDEYENHPTQKPEALLERIIKASSNPDDIVLDPFAGSFTTCAVAVRLNRRAIGIDLNKEYFKIGIRRAGIATEYEGEQLIKDRSRKTNAKSKNAR